MNSGEEVLAGFCALALKVFKIKVRTSLAESSLLSVLREQTQEFLLCKYPKVVRFQAVWLNFVNDLLDQGYYHLLLSLKLAVSGSFPSSKNVKYE